MKTGITKKHHNLTPGKFFLAYYIVILLILLWNLTHCTAVSWKTADAFVTQKSGSAVKYSDENPLELKDDAPITVRAAGEETDPDSSPNAFGKKPRLRGVALLGYENSRSLLFSGETVSAGIVNCETNEIVGEGTLLLKNQTPYPNDETSVYIALSEPVTQMLPDQLEVRFSTSGLTRNGIFIAGDAAAEDGEAPIARLYYERKKWNPLMPFLYFILEALAGLGCLLLYGERKFPLMRGSRSERAAGEGHTGSADAEKKEKRAAGAVGSAVQTALPAALILLFMVALMLYTYMHVIRKTAVSCTGGFLTGGSRKEDVVLLEPGATLRQSVTAGQDDFSGIGIRMTDENGKVISAVKTAACADAVLEWGLFDETGTAMLTGGSARIGDLKRVKSLLTKDTADEKLLAAAEESFVLALDDPVRESAGRKFVLQIALADQETAQQGLYLLATGDTNGQLEKGGPGKQTLPLEMCLTGTYRCNGFIKGMYLRISAFLLVMLAVLYCAALYLSRSGQGAGREAALMYLVSALCMGMVFSFATPAYTISDERTHIDSVYILSDRLLGINDQPGPKRLLKRTCDVDSSIANTMPVTVDRYRAVDRELFGAAPGTGRELIPAYTRSALDNVPILCYLPGAIGFSAARLLGRNMITMVMTARWFNLLACIMIMFLAIRRMPYGGAAMAVIGLFPKTLQMMASCSYDGMIIAGTFLFVSLCLQAAFGDDLCIADLLGLILAGLYVAACKGGAYLPVLGLALLIPAARSGSGAKMRRFWLTVTGGVLGGAVLLFAGKYVFRLLSMFGRESGKATIAAGTKTLYTLSDFIRSPGKLVRIYLSTIAVRTDGLIGELVGKNLSQRWFIVYFFIGLVLLGILRGYSTDRELSEREDSNHVRIPGRIWLLFLTAMSTALIFLSMLLAFTTKGSTYIDGLQGRYFLPIAILPVLAAENGLVRRKGISDSALLYTADVLLAVTFFEIMLAYLGGM